MKDEWWSKTKIRQWLREEWLITSTAVIDEIVGSLVYKKDGRNVTYHAPLEYT